MSEEFVMRSIKDLKGTTKQDINQMNEEVPLLEEVDLYLYRVLNKSDARRSSGYYSPSSLPYCARAMFYQRTEVRQQERILPSTRVIFDIGHAVHDVLQRYITNALGDDCFQVEVGCKDEGLHLRGSADGLLELDSQRRLLEIKSISPKGFKALASPKTEHLLQAHCYAYMLDTPLMWFLYYDKSSGNMRVFDTTFDRKVWGKALDKLERVERCVQKGNPPPYEASYKCRECKFFWHCQPPMG